MVYYETAPRANDLHLVRDYFRLEVDLPALARAFRRDDDAIAPALDIFAGLRVLRQDPVECLFSFLCTTAAPLYRIRKGIAGLCREFGDPFPGGAVAGLTHFAFPPVHRLAEASLSTLTRLGVGYRGRYIKDTAKMVTENGGPAWLTSLREKSYGEAKAALMTLPGVGEKIADCVCLFALNKDEAIPVDTHIRKIANREYLETPVAKTLTKHAYRQIGDALRAKFGPMAGWAQQYLFYFDLFEKGAWEAYTALYRPPGEETKPLVK